MCNPRIHINLMFMLQLVLLYKQLYKTDAHLLTNPIREFSSVVVCFFPKPTYLSQGEEEEQNEGVGE